MDVFEDFLSHEERIPRVFPSSQGNQVQDSTKALRPSHAASGLLPKTGP